MLTPNSFGGLMVTGGEGQIQTLHPYFCDPLWHFLALTKVNDLTAKSVNQSHLVPQGCKGYVKTIGLNFGLFYRTELSTFVRVLIREL